MPVFKFEIKVNCQNSKNYWSKFGIYALILALKRKLTWAKTSATGILLSVV